MRPAVAEAFTDEERGRLAPYFTNADGHIFALTNLPETVKGALFARYSRSAKSLRRLFLDEFADRMDAPAPGGSPDAGVARAEKLYARVFNEYGDDSVAQLGGAHIACEYVSNILTKVLEWGRLMAYLEQSTRYVPYTDRLHGRWRYHVPAELEGGALRERYVQVMGQAFELYAKWIPAMQAHFEVRYPKSPSDSDAVHRAAIRAKALDTLRGMLPSATQSNVGIYGTGQAYEALLLRMRAHPLAEVRDCADQMLAELRKVIPAFLTRVDQPDRGGAWSAYFAATRATMEALAARLASADAEPRDEVTLTDYDPDAEIRIVAAALYAVSDLPDDQLMALALSMTPDERASVLRGYVGDRTNRRHRPGRAFERTTYRFDVLTDYGAFRDLQRHRMLTLEWQPLTTRHGFTEPEAIAQAGAKDDWNRVMDGSADLYEAMVAAGLKPAAPYAVAMAHRVRFYLEMNPREAMHLIELRTAPQGHPAYRRVCQQMHRLIAEQAGHRALAAAMQFADHSAVALERLNAERTLERKRGE
ncbi:MAG: FAD-dependent thymidylate synthase [Acidobacteria bacterium]|nr:FAD-dependent thymidylate synthase [Acidobacteriota bacterium]